MIYKITGIFRNTEDAQSAAKRINSSADKIYEIRMNYLTRDEEVGLLNNILYSPPAMSIFSNTEYTQPMENVTKEYRTDSSRSSAIEYGETCQLTVLAEANNKDKVQSIMHNESGYDVNASELE